MVAAPPQLLAVTFPPDADLSGLHLVDGAEKALRHVGCPTRRIQVGLRFQIPIRTVRHQLPTRQGPAPHPPWQRRPPTRRGRYSDPGSHSANRSGKRPLTRPAAKSHAAAASDSDGYLPEVATGSPSGWRTISVHPHSVALSGWTVRGGVCRRGGGLLGYPALVG